MDDWIERLVKEAKELEDKLEKLEKFLKSEKYKTLPNNQQILLTTQAYIMCSYVNVLHLRLNIYASH